MSEAIPSPKSVERLFPFVLRSRCIIVGREILDRSKSRLHFILITEDLAESSRAEILANFSFYPIVQHYSEADLTKFFALKGTKVLGFAKSGLAQSIYAELKAYRINSPRTKSPRSSAPDSATPTSGAAVGFVHKLN